MNRIVGDLAASAAIETGFKRLLGGTAIIASAALLFWMFMS